MTIPFDAPFDVQIAAARARNAKLSDAYYRLPAEKRAQAFTVSALARLDQVQAVADALGRAQSDGRWPPNIRRRRCRRRRPHRATC